MKLRHLLSATLLFASFSAHAELIHQYRLNNSLVDDFGGPSLVANGGSFTADRYVFGTNQGLTLNENLGSVYTIDFVYNFSNQTSYRKLIDYRNRTSDNGVYTHTGRALFFVGGTYGGTGTQMLPNVDSQVTVTRDASGAMKAFVNKELMFSFMDSGSALTFGNIASFFMDDGAVGGEASPGQVDYIPIFNNALSVAEVSALGSAIAPPEDSTEVPEPASGALVLAGLGLLGFARRRQRAS